MAGTRGGIRAHGWAQHWNRRHPAGVFWLGAWILIVGEGRAFRAFLRRFQTFPI